LPECLEYKYWANLIKKRIKTSIMQQAKEGDVVRVHYTGRLVDGSTFDSSIGREPLEFTIGAGQMIKGFDKGVVGMTIGEKKFINVSPEEGYGEKDADAIIEFPLANVPEDMQLEVGMELTLSNEYGQPVPVVILEVGEEVVIMDANHRLAGKEMIFEVEMTSIA
jgi:peptidylprolyl isomerase